MSDTPSPQAELHRLRKASRRRLIGALVLMSAAGGVLWNVLDNKPQINMHPETLNVVSNLP